MNESKMKSKLVDQAKKDMHEKMLLTFENTLVSKTEDEAKIVKWEKKKSHDLKRKGRDAKLKSRQKKQI